MIMIDEYSKEFQQLEKDLDNINVEYELKQINKGLYEKLQDITIDTNDKG